MDALKALQEFHLATGIPAAVYQENTDTIRWASEGYLPELGLAMMRPYLNEQKWPAVLMTPESFLCGVMRFNGGGKIVLLGPVPVFECTRRQVQMLLQSLHQPLSHTDVLRRWLHTVPRCSQAQFQASLRLMAMAFGNDPEKEITFIRPNTPSDQLPERIESAHAFIEFTDSAFEERLLSCVEYGKQAELKQVIAELDASSERLPDFSMDSVKTFRSIFIISTTLAARSANRGGMAHSVSSYIADRYLSQVENIESYRDFIALWTRMLLEYTEKTAKCQRLQTDSILVSKICKDIQAHIYDRVAVSQIAQRLGMSNAYLCRHFKGKTGITITQYIQQEKVGECMRLLKTTHMTLSQIAEQLGFSSQNYMQTVFKRHTGSSPAAYRKQL